MTYEQARGEFEVISDEDAIALRPELILPYSRDNWKAVIGVSRFDILVMWFEYSATAADHSVVIYYWNVNLLIWVCMDATGCDEFDDVLLLPESQEEWNELMQRHGRLKAIS